MISKPQALVQSMTKYCFQVVEGGVEETIELLKEKFDYIFFTGSTTVGQKVRDAANKHLTPVTLELGGKCPTYVDSSADMDIVARRLLWAKCINLGQTCIAPDYILCSSQVQAQLVDKMKTILFEWYGKNPQDSEHLCRIINDRNWQRLNQLLQSSQGKVVIGGETDQSDLYIAPTVVTGVKEDDSLMKDELFGPIFPIMTVAGPQEAIKFINSRPKPLRLKT